MAKFEDNFPREGSPSNIVGKVIPKDSQRLDHALRMANMRDREIKSGEGIGLGVPNLPARRNNRIIDGAIAIDKAHANKIIDAREDFKKPAAFKG